MLNEQFKLDTTIILTIMYVIRLEVYTARKQWVYVFVKQCVLFW